MRRFIVSVALVALLAPASLEAQQRTGADNRWSLEPYAGAFFDSYAPEKDAGALAGLRLGYELSRSFRLVADVGYAEVNEAGRVGLVGPDMVVYGNDWFLTTAGAEWDVVPGRTSATLGLRVGAGWRSTEAERLIGSPDQQWRHYADQDGYSAYDVVAPSVALRHAFGSRAELGLRLDDYMFDVLEGPVEHSPAVTVGFTIR